MEACPPDYVDHRESEINDRERKKAEEKKKAEKEEEESRFDKLPKERQEELLKKVEELQRNKERKEKLRAAFNAHVEEKKSKATVQGTDYHAWDLWTPSDEEDELYNNLTPNSPEFKAMEKDIDERHAKLLRSRQFAERQRVLGNDYFKGKQYAKALQVYEEGIASEKSNMALNANAAAAALKLGCNIQAIEHCDKVFSIADFCFENKPSTIPMRLKAFQRRATARLALRHFREALADLEEAKKLAGEDDKEVNQQILKAQKAYDEHKIAKKLKKVVDGDDLSESGEAEKLREISNLSKEVHVGSGKKAEACEKLADILEDFENGRIFSRECGMLNKVLQLYVESVKGASGQGTARKSALNAIKSACSNDQNAQYVCDYPMFLDKSISNFVKNEQTLEEDFAFLGLLHACSIEAEPRRRIAEEMIRAGRAGGGGQESAILKLCTFIKKDTKSSILLASLQLLCNLCLHNPFRKTLVDSSAEALWQFVEKALEIISAKDLVGIHETVGSLLGNLCNNRRVRLMFSERESSLKSLLDNARMAKLNKASKERFPKLLNVISNLAVEEANQEALCKLGGVLRLLDLLEAQKEHSKQIVGCLARLSKVPSGAKTLVSSGNISKLFGRVGGGTQQGIPREMLDPMVRVAANVIMKSGLGVETVSDCLFPLGFYALCKTAITDPESSDLVVGNAALCISEVAKSEAVLAKLDAAGAIDLIEPLTKIAHKRQGGAQKNAAIALARLAKCGKDGQYIEKLREHHAFEIIAKYVKL